MVHKRLNNIIILVIIFFILMIFLVSPTYAKEVYKRTIIIDNTQNSNSLTDYQTLITINTDSLIATGKMRADCADIVIKDSDDKTVLQYFWIENCNNFATKIWVKIPLIPASSTKEIYLYYGTSSIVQQSSVQKTFIREIEGLAGAWPMNEQSGSIVADTSGNNRTGSANGTVATPNGKFNYARSFTERNDLGWNERIWTSNPSINTNFTMEAWVNPGKTFVPYAWTWGQSYVFFPNMTEAYSGDQRLAGAGLSVGTNGIAFIEHSGNYIPTTLYYGTALSGWNHIVITVNNNAKSLYLNGKYITTNPAGRILYAPNMIGDGSATTGPWSDYGPFTGIIDEPKIYSRPLTADEVRDEAANYGYSTPYYPGKVLVRQYSSPEPIASYKTIDLAIDVPEAFPSNSPKTVNVTNYRLVNFVVRSPIIRRHPKAITENRIQIRLDSGVIIPLQYQHSEGEETIWTGQYKIPRGTTNNERQNELTGSVEAIEYPTTTTTITHFANLARGFTNTGITLDYEIKTASPGSYTIDNSTSSASIKFNSPATSSSSQSILQFISQIFSNLKNWLIKIF